ncbi:helix-turn-helix domain-containing protein [Myxococcota bacterium]|nr:helix-turn-helix domain-containing protein [Myxococcota bacterium]
MATQATTDIGTLLTSKEAAARMRVSVDYLLGLALRGEVQSVKIGSRPGQRGGRRLFPESEVNGWIARNLRAE